MNLRVTRPSRFARGATLIEAVIAIGVLAVAIPMVFGTIAEAGKSGMATEAETRSVWIVPACMEEVRASREGRSQYFAKTTIGQTFPNAGDVWALAFSPEGRPIGKLAKSAYDAGVKELNGSRVGYIATMTSAQAPVKAGTTPMLRLHVAVEYPAAAKSTRRSKLDFHTRIP